MDADANGGGAIEREVDRRLLQMSESADRIEWRLEAEDVTGHAGPSPRTVIVRRRVALAFAVAVVAAIFLAPIPGLWHRGAGGVAHAASTSGGGSGVVTTAHGPGSPTTSTVPTVSTTPLGRVQAGATLLSVSCATATGCVAVGSDGLVASTTHGPVAGWRFGRAGPRALDLVGVSCPSAERCVAVGSKNIAIKSDGDPEVVAVTIDGGRSWAVQDLAGRYGALSSVSCPSATTCFAAGFDGASLTTVLVSHDGGTSWAALTLPRIESLTPGLGPSPAISCESASQCVVLSTASSQLVTGFSQRTTILSTFDGGQRWSTSSPPVTTAPGRDLNASTTPTLTTVACPTVTECVAGGAFASEGMMGGYQAIYRSVDGGLTWTQVTGSSIRNLGQAGFQDSFVLALSCPSNLRCVAIVASGGSGATAVALSSDGGTSWNSVSLAVPPVEARRDMLSVASNGSLTLVSAALACPEVVACALVASSPWHAGLVTNVVLGTLDSGRTWTVGAAAPAG